MLPKLSATGLGLGLAAVLSALPSATAVAVADDAAAYDAAQMQTLLGRYCVDCHSADYAEAGFRVDDLTLDAEGMADAESLARLVKVHDRLKAGEMPPSDADAPSDQTRQAAVAMLASELHAADVARQQRDGRTRRRRMTRGEYQNAVHDLLYIDTPIVGMLPGDAVAHGFDKTADALGLSSVLMQQYLKASRAAVESAVVLTPRPETTTTRYSLLEDYKKSDHLQNVHGRLFKPLDDGLVIYCSKYCPTELREMDIETPGRYRITVSAYAYRNVTTPTEPAPYRLFAGPLFRSRGESELLGFFEAQPKAADGTVRTITTTAMLPKRSTLQLKPWDTGYTCYQKTDEPTDERAVVLQWVDVTGPLVDQWPPRSQRVIFGDLPIELTNAEQMKTNRWAKPRYEVASDDPKADARRLLTRFAARAFRRPVETVDAEPFVQLVHDRLDAGESFTNALPLGYQAILCDPMFLTVGCDAGTTDLAPHAIASRMSLFLWGSTPDDELLGLAESGAIAEPSVRREQVRRMLADARRERFIDDFATQWLDLAWIDASTPDPELFPEYDDLLRESMVTETKMTLRYLFDENRPVRETVDADYAFLDERLAQHYGIEGTGLRGLGFEKVSLPPDSLRGGFLTQASIAKVTANGTHTSPVYRGSWVLDAILGQPVPPPPPNVPAVEPDVRGAKTIRELLAKHREDSACAVCHDRLDPAGFAMEELDVIGRQRDVYRVPKDAGGKHSKSQIGNREIHVFENLDNPLDSSGTLPNGQPFADLRSFKKLIAADDRQLARAMAEKLLVYGTGEGVSFCDREAIEEIVQRTESSQFGMASLLEEVIASDVFAQR